MINKMVKLMGLRSVVSVIFVFLSSISHAGDYLVIASGGVYEFDTEQLIEDVVGEVRVGYVSNENLRFEVNYINFGSAEIVDAPPGVDTSQEYELIGIAMGAEGQLTDTLGVQGRVGGGQARHTSVMFNDDETDDSYFFGFGMNWAPGEGAVSVIAEVTRFVKLTSHDIDVAQVGLQVKF